MALHLTPQVVHFLKRCDGAGCVPRLKSEAEEAFFNLFQGTETGIGLSPKCLRFGLKPFFLESFHD
jgi:hypothetical protein